jgi:hypothetical protein
VIDLLIYSSRLRSRPGGMRLSVRGSTTAEFLSTAKKTRDVVRLKIHLGGAE